MIYSKQGWANINATFTGNGKAKRLESSNQVLKYAAIRIRADKQFPKMKEDVYDDLFARGQDKMLDVDGTQFMGPFGAAATVGSVGFFGAYIGVRL